MSIEIQNIKKSYQQSGHEIEILKGLNANISTGEVTAIVGPSGSGKSTFLSLMSGLDHPDSGSIRIEGTAIEKLSERELTQFRAQNIGIVFQQFHLLSHLTALENVMLPMEILAQADIENRATKALTELGLEHRLNHFPSQLSGGECQRVAIARALVVRPKLLLADEPSGNLDVKTGQAVMDVFFRVVKEHKITTLLVTHSEEVAQRCQHSLTLRDGLLQ
jgi:putative ABC transport system ATP-binding protein